MLDLMGKKYYFFAFSLLLIVAGIVGFIVNGGFQMDVQFQGGTIIQIQMNDSNYDTAKAEEIVMKTTGKKAVAQKSQTLNVNDASKKINLLQLTISNANETLSGDELNKTIDALRKDFNIKQDAQINVENIQPFIGKEIRDNGIKAAIWASVLIILYIWWRFNVMSGLSAGVMAVLALLHDAAIMLSVYAVFKVPLNDAFIAAVLTILGYSMNDTIIIYDRIRENSNLLRKVPIAELVNKSIVQTLARSINTVVTVLICITTVYIFAVMNNIESVKEFSFPLIVGIASGCYSSIFIASPLWVMWKESQAKKKVAAAKPAKA